MSLDMRQYHNRERRGWLPIKVVETAQKPEPLTPPHEVSI